MNKFKLKKLNFLKRKINLIFSSFPYFKILNQKICNFYKFFIKISLKKVYKNLMNNKDINYLFKTTRL